MMNVTITNADRAETLLRALGDQLTLSGDAFHVVVVGGSALLPLGQPEGFEERLATREYGPALTVSSASRLDQIHLKLYATVDAGGPGKHEQDLRALEPTRDELVAAARWSRTHDPSEGYHEMLRDALAFFGVEDADLGA